MKGVGGTPNYTLYAMMYIVVDKYFDINDTIKCFVSVTDDNRIRIVPFSSEPIERPGNVNAYKTEIENRKKPWSLEFEDVFKINDVDQNKLNQLRIFPPSDNPIPIVKIHRTNLNILSNNYTCETNRSRYILKFMTPGTIRRYENDKKIHARYKDLHNNEQMKQYFKNFHKMSLANAQEHRDAVESTVNEEVVDVEPSSSLKRADQNKRPDV